jgi:hypothetical protein
MESEAKGWRSGSRVPVGVEVAVGTGVLVLGKLVGVGGASVAVGRGTGVLVGSGVEVARIGAVGSGLAVSVGSTAATQLRVNESSSPERMQL